MALMLIVDRQGCTKIWVIHENKAVQKHGWSMKAKLYKNLDNPWRLYERMYITRSPLPSCSRVLSSVKKFCPVVQDNEVVSKRDIKLFYLEIWRIHWYFCLKKNTHKKRALQKLLIFFAAKISMDLKIPQLQQLTSYGWAMKIRLYKNMGDPWKQTCTET